MRFSSARDQAEETRRRHNAAARRALELARPNVMLSYMESNSAPMSFISSKLGTASSLMSGYEETGDESQSARNCPDAATEALYKADGGTLGHLREAVTTFEEIERTARRVLGGAHPTTKGIERALQKSRAALARASLAKLERSK